MEIQSNWTVLITSEEMVDVHEETRILRYDDVRVWLPLTHPLGKQVALLWLPRPFSAGLTSEHRNPLGI